MAEIDRLEIKIESSAKSANNAIDSLIKSLDKLSSSLKFDTSSLEKLGNINGNNFKKLGEGLQSFANAAKTLENVNSGNFTKLANGLEKIASIDPSKLEALGKIDGNSFRGLGEGVKALSSGLQNLQGIKKSDFNRLATGIERLASIQPGNMESVGNALKPLADGINILSNANFDNNNLQNFINSLTRLSNANTASLTTIDFEKLGISIKGLADTLSGAEKVEQNTISMTNAIAKLANSGENANIAAEALPLLGANLKDFMLTMSEAAKLEADTIAFTQALAQLANAGKRTEATATGLPKLGEELRKVFDVMSKAPTISQSTIQFTQALAQLASTGKSAGNAVQSISNSMTSVKSRMMQLGTSLKSFTKQLLASMGVYLGIYGIVRGIKNSITGATDYIEAFNYYTVAFGKIASEFDKKWEEYGSEGARNYANAFVTEMNETLGKLSGVQVELSDDYTEGILIETGVKNLGLNIQEITQYASQLASVTNSIGQTGEVSLAAAKSMTMLAGDISSLFNIDFSDVAQNLQSGLIGQSRALYKYGIDITNATLQTYAYNLGLEKSVSEMTQAEKMQLRMLAILEQSKVSWGDLANTINSPSNMLRQFKNNVKELGMVFGQLFIPVLQKVMPVINGVAIALKRLVVNIAGFLGVKIDFESFGQGYSDIGEELEGLADDYDDAAKAAKKYQNQLLGFDEAYVLKEESDATKDAASLSGIDLTQQIVDATSEYEKVWSEAFTKMENTAQAWADRIEKALEPVKKIFKDFAVGDFFQLGQDTSHLVAGIFDFFADAIDKVDWYGIGQKIGDFFAGIDWGEIMSSGANLAVEAYKGAVELSVGTFANIPDWMKFTFGGGLGLAAGKILEYFTKEKDGIEKIKISDSLPPLIFDVDVEFSDQIETFIDSYENLSKQNKENIDEIIAKFEGIKKIADEYLELSKNYDTLTDSQKNMVSTYGKIISENVTDSGKYIDEVTGKWLGTTDQMTELIDKTEEYYKQLAKQEILVDVYKNQYQAEKKFQKAKSDANKYTEDLLGKYSELYKSTGNVEYKNMIRLIRAMRVANGDTSKLSESNKKFYDRVIKTDGAMSVEIGTVQELSQTYQNAEKAMDLVIDDLILYGSYQEKDRQALKGFTGEIEDMQKVLGQEMKVDITTDSAMSSIKTFTQNTLTTLGKIKPTPIEVFTPPVTENSFGVITGLKNGLVELGTKVYEVKVKADTTDASGKLDKIKGKISELAKKLTPTMSRLLEMNLAAVGIKFRVPQYAVGGFPEDGLFMANHGELVGKFANGKTAVANNEDIMGGIEAAVYRAMSEANINSNNGNQQPIIKVYVGNKELEDIAIEGINNRIMSGGRIPLYI